MERRMPREKGSCRSDRRTDDEVLPLIRDKLEEHCVKTISLRVGSEGTIQLGIPFEGASMPLPPDVFPIDPLPLARRFFPEARICPDPHPGIARDGHPLAGWSSWGLDPHGAVRPVIWVRAEDFRIVEPPETVDQFSAMGRFVSGREIARLLTTPREAFLRNDQAEGRKGTPVINPGEYLAPGFFRDRLNALAMALCCPGFELRRLLAGIWGSLPVSREAVVQIGPMFQNQLSTPF